MSKLTLYRSAVICALIGVALGAIVSAQSRPSTQDQIASSNELLTEIKALRADLNQKLDATIRAQLMVARLQLQEQRITTISRQLTDVQLQLQTNERGRAPIEGQLKMFEESVQANQSEADKKGANFLVDMLRNQVEQMTKADEELKRQQVYLSGLLAEEQSRWTAFNARLEELERALTTKTPPRDR